MTIGETVVVLSPVEGDPDEMGDPTITWEQTTVDGCLVRQNNPVRISDSSEIPRPEGFEVKYSLAFPKDYSGPALRGCRVALVDRGMAADDADAAYLVYGNPEIVKEAPTNWNMLAHIGRAVG